MEFEEKVIECQDCGTDFVHSAEDQARYAERGFTNDPKRCRECREKRKTQHQGGRGDGGGGRGPRPQQRRESFDAVCAECGVSTTVPFKPVEGRPVYCRDCYRARQP